MSLVERLMGLKPDGTVPIGALPPEERKISIHGFFAACNEVAVGALTVAQVKAYLNMDATTATEFDQLIALSPGPSNQGTLAMFLNRIHGVFLLGEEGAPGYNTPAGVRAKILGA